MGWGLGLSFLSPGKQAAAAQTVSLSTSQCLEVSRQTGERVCRYAVLCIYSLARRRIGVGLAGVVR
jgi:hypothetical protein